MYRRRFKHEPGGWICGPHWKLIPMRFKRVLYRLQRKGRRFVLLIGHNPLRDRERRVWARIEREMGW